MEAAQHPDPKVSDSKLKQFTDPGDKKISEQQLLLQAAWKGHVAAATKLLQEGTDKETRDSSGWAPLLVAVMQYQTRLVKLLLAYDAEPGTKCDLGLRTPLH